MASQRDLPSPVLFASQSQVSRQDSFGSHRQLAGFGTAPFLGKIPPNCLRFQVPSNSFYQIQKVALAIPCSRQLRITALGHPGNGDPSRAIRIVGLP